MGKFEKGQSGNKKGRPKGATNLEAAYLRNGLISFLNELAPMIYESYLSEKISNNARARMKSFEGLLPFALPKLQNVEFRGIVDLLTNEQAIELRKEIEAKIDKLNDDI